MTTKPRPAAKSLFQAAMARYSAAEIDAALAEYPETDGEPLPDGFEQEPEFTEIVGTVRGFFRGRPDVIVSGDTFVYYEQGTQRRVAPDCYVAFGVSAADIPPYNSYLIWRMGKPPDFVLEIGSKSTARVDTGPKRILYAHIGIGEYWCYDPTDDSKHYGAKLIGERLSGGEYVRLPMGRMPDGSPWGHSPTLGLDLCWTAEILRFHDPASGLYLPTRKELDDALRVSENARQAAEAEAAALRAQLRRLRGE